VHITELGGEYFRFDEARQELRGERTGVRYAIGTRVRVQVSRVDLDGRKIDFRLVREGETDAWWTASASRPGRSGPPMSCRRSSSAIGSPKRPEARRWRRAVRLQARRAAAPSPRATAGNVRVRWALPACHRAYGEISQPW